MFEMPTKNDAFLQLAAEKKHHYWRASQTNFGTSKFVRALEMTAKVLSLLEAFFDLGLAPSHENSNHGQANY